MGATFDDKDAALLEQIREDQAAIKKLGAAIDKAKQAASSARAAARDAERAYIRLRTKQVTLTYAIQRKREKLRIRRRAWREVSIADAERLLAMRGKLVTDKTDQALLHRIGIGVESGLEVHDTGMIDGLMIDGLRIVKSDHSKAFFSALADRLRAAKAKKKGGKS